MLVQTRLSLAVAIVSILGLGSPDTGLAATRCRQTSQGELCISSVNFNAFAQSAYQAQQASQWCWAASISMLYSYFGHPVSQQRIVSEVYGGIVNLPAGSGYMIAKQLNRKWTDDNGKKFTSKVTAAYDYDAKVLGISNDWIIKELDQDRPIVIGTGTHAVVGTAIQYYKTQRGPNVVSVGVFDPWPGIGARNLYLTEMTPMHLKGTLRFVASVKVTSP